MTLSYLTVSFLSLILVTVFMCFENWDILWIMWSSGYKSYWCSIKLWHTYGVTINGPWSMWHVNLSPFPDFFTLLIIVTVLNIILYVNFSGVSMQVMSTSIIRWTLSLMYWSHCILHFNHLVLWKDWGLWFICVNYDLSFFYVSHECLSVILFISSSFVDPLSWLSSYHHNSGLIQGCSVPIYADTTLLYW